MFASLGDFASWFDGFESCVGQRCESADPDTDAHISFERFEVPDLGDESRGFRTIISYSDGPNSTSTPRWFVSVSCS